ncbi:hypothetical protein YC2023_095226 [Brassica napus]
MEDGDTAPTIRSQAPLLLVSISYRINLSGFTMLNVNDEPCLAFETLGGVISLPPSDIFSTCFSFLWVHTTLFRVLGVVLVARKIFLPLHFLAIMTCPVKVSTVLGSKAPALIVKLAAQALSSGSKGSSVINNQVNNVASLTILLDESAHEKVYITEAQTKPPQELLDSDVGSVESQKKLDLSKDGAVSLSANHLQKLRLSYQLNTPLGHVFKPHQVLFIPDSALLQKAFLKLKHESQVEHIFLVKTSGKKSELVLVKFLKLHFEFLFRIKSLTNIHIASVKCGERNEVLKTILMIDVYCSLQDFLGLVEKLYYLSGKYEIQLTIGDASMENSLLSNIGHIELDLPERPEKAAQPPVQPTDPYSRYGPKAEISHIFRVPEKLPAKQLSLVFLGLIVLPFIAFLIGVSLLSLLTRLGVNIKSFPSSVGAGTSARCSEHKGTFFVGSVSVVRGTQYTLSPRISIEQVEICLKNIYSLVWVLLRIYGDRQLERISEFTCTQSQFRKLTRRVAFGSSLYSVEVEPYLPKPVNDNYKEII